MVYIDIIRGLNGQLVKNGVQRKSLPCEYSLSHLQV
jgi:hypothetical protein